MLRFAQQQRIFEPEKVELDAPHKRLDRHNLDNRVYNKLLIVRTIVTLVVLNHKVIAQTSISHSEKAQPLEEYPKALTSRQPHPTHCDFKLHLHLNIGIFSTHCHLLQLISPTDTALLSGFEFNNTPECPPQVQLPHRTHLRVLPSSLGEESLRQSPHLIGAESTRPP